MNSKAAFPLAVWVLSSALGYATYAGVAFAVAVFLFVAVRQGRDILTATVVDECRRRFAGNERKMLWSIALISAWISLLVLLAGATAENDLVLSLIAALGGQLFATFLIVAIALKSQRKAERP